jgi:DNA-damage-inducible protein D
MKHETVITLTDTFESHAQETEGGIEFWLARDLQQLLGYSKWDNFLNVVSKAKTACEVSGHEILDHFADVGKMVDLGSGSQREVDDIMLTGSGGYATDQKGERTKRSIGFAPGTSLTRRVAILDTRAPSNSELWPSGHPNPTRKRGTSPPLPGA